MENNIKEYRVLLENEIRSIRGKESHNEVPTEIRMRYLGAFKTGGRLGSLRDALSRLDAKAFGICLLCRCEIEEAFLRKDLTTRICFHCAAGQECGSKNTNIRSINVVSNTES